MVAALFAGLVAVVVIAGVVVLTATAPVLSGVNRLPNQSAGPSTNTTATVPASSTIPPNSAPVRGGTLVYALPTTGNGLGFDPFGASPDLSLDLYGRRLSPVDMIEVEAMFDPLFAFDANGHAAPYLAETARTSADFRTWTVSLRPGVQFHDDTPADAAAVARHLEAARQSAVLAPLLRPVSGVTVVDALTVEVDLAEPWATFPVALTGQAGLLSGLLGPDRVPAGTGPFTTENFRPEWGRNLTANTRYWRPGLPLIDRLQFQYVDDGQSRLSVVKAGTADLVRLDGTERETPLNPLTADDPDGLQFITDTIAPSVYLVALDTSKPPFDDPAVRRRLVDATNQANLVASVFSGAGLPIRDLPLPGIPGANVSPPPTMFGAISPPAGNVTTAPAVPFTLLIHSRRSDDQAIAQVLQQQWLGFGFGVTVMAVDNIRQHQSRSRAHHAVLTFGMGGADPLLDAPLWDPAARIDGSPSFPFAIDVDDPALAEAARTGRASDDPATRLTAYQQASNRLAELQPIIWLGSFRPSIVASRRVRAFVNATLPDGTPAAPFDGDGVHRLTETWLDRS